MADEQMRPSSKELAPDPSYNYERSHPQREAGMGRMDNVKAVPANTPDKTENAVGNKQPPRQINADEVVNERASESAQPSGSMPPPEAVDHSMNDEEPLGWDQAPAGGGNAGRQPRQGGKGGTPNEGESRRKG